MMVPEWPLLSGRKMETSWKCQWWYLIKWLRSTGKEFFKTERGFVFIFRNISECNSLRVVSLNVWSFLLSVTYLLFPIQFYPVEHAHGLEIDREAPYLVNGCKDCGQVLPRLTWVWAVFLPWNWKKGGDDETDWKLRRKLNLLVTFWCVVLQTVSSVPWA